MVADEISVKRHTEYRRAEVGNANDATVAAKRLASEYVTPKTLSTLFGVSRS
jgi:hypothetical protein